MTLAELKRRLTPGTKLRCIHNARGPCNDEREVTKTSSSHVRLRGKYGDKVGEAYLNWPKASQLSATERGFRIDYAAGPQSDSKRLEYEWA